MSEARSEFNHYELFGTSNEIGNVVRLIPRPWKFALLSKILGGDVAARSLGVKVGKGSRIYSCKVASEYWLVSIGSRTTVSVDVLFVTHDGTGWLFNDQKGRRFRYAPISVGDDCFIGARSIIMPGVSIGNRVIVAAGSVVTRSVPEGCIVAGVPATVIGDYGSLMERIQEWPSQEERAGKSYREQVDSIAELDFRPLLRVPSEEC